MGEKEGKERMTLWLDKAIKEELKNQAKSSGVSVSAYISMLTSMRRAENTNGK